MLLIISSNPLFKEVIGEATGQLNIQRKELLPEEALARICAYQPKIILLDETIEPALFEAILGEARKLPQTRTIVLNPQRNEFILLDSRKAILRKVDDLMEVMTNNPSVNVNAKGQIFFSDRAVDADARSQVYGFLATVLDIRPDNSFVKRLRSFGVDALTGLIKEENSDNVIRQGIQAMADFLKLTAEISSEKVEELLAVDWTRLFRGISPNYGPPPPYEAVYIGDGRSQVEIMQSLNRYYLECGSLVEQDYGNRLDYLGLELGFMSHLAELEAAAWKEGNFEQAEILEGKARSFLNQHLGLWVDKFITAALAQAKTEFFKGFLLLTRGVVTQAVEQVRNS